MNYRELKDPNYNFYEKCATFDGPAHLSEPSKWIREDNYDSNN